MTILLGMTVNGSSAQRRVRDMLSESESLTPSMRRVRCELTLTPTPFVRSSRMTTTMQAPIKGTCFCAQIVYQTSESIPKGREIVALHLAAHSGTEIRLYHLGDLLKGGGLDTTGVKALNELLGQSGTGLPSPHWSGTSTEGRAIAL